MIRSLARRFFGSLRRQNDRFPLQEAEELTRTAQELGITVQSLNREAAKRQATIGKSYARDRHTAARLAELQDGTVTLPPHQPWTGDYTDWSADPFGDLNWRFQFHTLRWINPYLWDAFEGNEESQAEWKRIVRSWADKNIPVDQARDKYAWTDMTDGNRAIQTSLGAPLMGHDDQWYVDLLVTHRNWLLDDRKIVPGNHGLHQNLGLFVVAAVLNDEIGIQRAIERLGGQILEAFDEDGMNEEGSVAYHQSNLVWWLQGRERLLLEGYDFPSAAIERLDRAGDALAHLLLPDGTMPQIGDGGRGKGRSGLHPLLDQVLKAKVDKPGPSLLRYFSNGFMVCRGGWGHARPLKLESHTVVRHGVDLQRHSHNDRGSVHIYTLGRRWITDGGFHSYQQGSPDRNYTKSRSAHSLVSLPNLPYDETGDVPTQLIQDEDNLHSIQILDENFKSAQWRRRVIYLPQLDIWIIWDRVSAKTPQLTRQQWLIDVGVKVTQPTPSTALLEDKAHKLEMRWYGPEPAIDIAEGDSSSESNRGQIGIGWKCMRNGTSIHANMNSSKAEYIVVISPLREKTTDIELTQRSSQNSFELSIRHETGNYQLSVLPHSNRLRCVSE